ncbi:meprin A subunit alpha-like [Ambystoma mexicanum]|uniref:meprin A subunit alpha-like n=1 Tax=Ambystoma mexicanum TaxID=8296 RepID=UPI0037E74330
MAPLKLSKSIKHRSEPWFSDEIKFKKLACREAERNWRLCYSTIAKLTFRNLLTNYHQTIVLAKKTFFDAKIEAAINKPKALFKLVSSLSAPTKMDSAITLSQVLCDSLAIFFASKIKCIHAAIAKAASATAVCQSPPWLAAPTASWLSFSVFSNFEILKAIHGLKSASPADAIRLTLMKDLNAKGVILQAFEMFRLKSCVDFKPYEGEKTYIKFEKLDGCWSYVGDLHRGQSLSIGEGCDYKAIVEHELLHALGFYHEHSRTDRDDYVHIWWDEIIEGYAYAFDRYDDDFITDLNTPYDYDSVMHYGPLSFNKNDVPTITTKLPAFNDLIGQRFDMSKIDLERLNRMYNCTSTLATLDKCSFELTNICGMVQNVQEGAEWIHTKSKDGEEDHTLVGGCRDGGYFMHLDTSTGQAKQSALLESRVLYPQSSRKCLQFFYKMNGSPQDQITVWIRKDDGTGNVRRMSKLKSIQGDGENAWKLAHVAFDIQARFRYVFQGTKGDPAKSMGGIFIDDVTLTETNCPSNVWHISNFSKLMQTTVKGDSLLSPVYHSSEGYSYGLKLYPHGTLTSRYNNYVAVTFHLCSSENDGVLEWPAGNRQIVLIALDQDPNAVDRMSLSKSFTTKPNDLVAGRNDTFLWDKPSTTGSFDLSCNCSRGPDVGWVTFVSHSEMQRKSFLKNDDFFIFSNFEARQTKHTAERLWREAPSIENLTCYKQTVKCYKEIILHAKAKHFNDRIHHGKSHTKEIFSILQELKKPLVINQTQESNAWCQAIHNRFNSKTEKHQQAIKEQLQSLTNNIPTPERMVQCDKIPSEVFFFERVSEPEVLGTIHKPKPSSCKGDAFPAKLFKDFADTLAPWVTHFVNQSFDESYVPNNIKEAWITPLLKKDNLDPSIPGNFRPITNVPFLLKIIDKIAYEQYQKLIESNTIMAPRQPS